MCKLKHHFINTIPQENTEYYVPIKLVSFVRWPIIIIPTFKRQEDSEFEASLDNTSRPV